MKITIDTENKQIIIKEGTSLRELMELEKVIPSEWKGYTVTMKESVFMPFMSIDDDAEESLWGNITYTTNSGNTTISYDHKTGETLISKIE